MTFAGILALLGLLCWVGVLRTRPNFWRAQEHLDETAPLPDGSTLAADGGPIVAIIPARDEAEGIGRAVTSLLTQTDLATPIRVVVVDDGSTDGTAEVARTAAEALPDGAAERLTTLTGATLPQGWTGKLWAVQQGLDHVRTTMPEARWILMTDADIDHASGSVVRLQTLAERDRLSMISLMVQLRCESLWERLLVPAFVFFFRKLYPFDQVADPNSATAGAAGGCMLIRRAALERIGGMRAVRGSLIDDCSLGERLKRDGPIALMTAEHTRSLRAYPDLGSFWTMVARTAYAQLNNSLLLLVATTIGMVLLYLSGPIAFVTGLAVGAPLTLLLGLAAWAIPALLYAPTLVRYGRPRLMGLVLPFIAGLYALMTIDSARRHKQGRGGQWKGRSYGPESALTGTSPVDPDSLSPDDDPQRHTEAITRKASTSFFAGMRLLPPPRRHAMYAIYAFCRIVDDIADEPGEEAEKRRELAVWRQTIDRLYETLGPGPYEASGQDIPLPPEDLHPVAKALLVPIVRYGLQQKDFHAVIDGMETDAAPAVRLPDIEALELYCDQVACAVGRLSNGAFGLDPELGDPLATAQGLALQLTNILRDVDEDAGRDRIYLPAAGLRSHGVETPEDPAAVLTHPGTKQLCAELHHRAGRHFNETDRLHLQADRKAVRPAIVMKEVYRLYHKALAKRGWDDLRKPVKVSGKAKAATALLHGYVLR
ncbi:MAG: presqualene diphosphate synthase HpnD [Rhodospirillaceae bacterium]